MRIPYVTSQARFLAYEHEAQAGEFPAALTNGPMPGREGLGYLESSAKKTFMCQTIKYNYNGTRGPVAEDLS